MQILLGQRGAGFAADGINGKFLLELVIGVVRYVADAAAVDDGSFFLFGKKPVKFRIVAGGDDQGIELKLYPTESRGE